MAWSVDDSKQRKAFNHNKHFGVEASAMSKYHQWKRLVNGNTPPNMAAIQVGDMNYEQLSGKNKGEYTIRLSKQHRAAFTITGQKVEVFQIGGHYPNETN